MAKQVGSSNKTQLALPSDFEATMANLRNEVLRARASASYAVNRAQLDLYWHVGRVILDKQAEDGWGAKVIEALGERLSVEFPGMGWSRSNMKYMRQLPSCFSDRQAFGQQAAGQMPWSSLQVLLDKFADEPEVIAFYADRVVSDGLSRDAMKKLIATSAHLRRGKAISNFTQALATEHATLVQESLNDPVTLGFLGATDAIAEIALETRLVEQIQQTMRSLGFGLAYIGRQVPLRVGSKDFLADLLFFNVDALCYTVVELKVEEYKAEFAGKMNLYISAVDRQRRNPNKHNPTVGVILVPGRDTEVVDASIPGMLPMAVVSYTLNDIPAVRDVEAHATRELEAAPPPSEM